MRYLIWCSISLLFFTVSLNAQTDTIKTEDDSPWVPEVKDNRITGLNNYNDPFASRYFISSNGLPLVKGEYLRWNLYGPDIQLVFNKRLSVGLTTTWIGTPVLGNVKYTIFQGDNIQFGGGILGGASTWLLNDIAVVVPFTFISAGDVKSNICLTTGYGSMLSGGSAPSSGFIMCIAGTHAFTPKLSLVFDSFITMTYTGEYEEGIALVMPGLRWYTNSGNAFQFGFIAIDGGIKDIPIPMIQLFRKI